MYNAFYTCVLAVYAHVHWYCADFFAQKNATDKQLMLKALITLFILSKLKKESTYKLT